ncbi:uncharacterized protein LOC144129139 isoform X1 [Amblyomma americanum]
MPHEVTCQPSCEDGYALPSNVPDIYVCDRTGVWDARPWLPHCRARILSTATVCPRGHDRVRDDGEENKDCVECPPGMFWSQDTNECLFCKPGFYQDQPGQSSCKPCPANSSEPPVLSPHIEQQCQP